MDYRSKAQAPGAPKKGGPPNGKSNESNEKKMDAAAHARKAASHARRAMRLGMDARTCANSLGPALAGPVMSSLSRAASAIQTLDRYTDFAMLLWRSHREPQKPQKPQRPQRPQRRRKRAAFGEFSSDVDATMNDEAQLAPIALFEFTEKAQHSMRRFVWTSNTDCAINALQVTGVVGGWCADIMRILMRDLDTGMVSGGGRKGGVHEDILTMAYEHAYCMQFYFTRIRRMDLIAAVRSIRIGGCIVVATSDHVTVVVMSVNGPYFADLQKPDYMNIGDLKVQGGMWVLRYIPNSDAASVGSSIRSERCLHGPVQTRHIEPLYPSQAH